ncbi:hypothetical protein HA402_005723 [Bradysia odoriphaga]|nr:hypothetical protein HA402_005723 [Bradysia odoriphaga]
MPVMRPPMSSDEEDEQDDFYEGFSFGNEFDRPAREVTQNQWILKKQKEDDEHDRILHTIKNGNLEGLKQELLRKFGSEARIQYDEYLKDGWTILLHAVACLQRDIVTYLVSKGANLNCEAGSMTPLMVVCDLEICPSQIDDILDMTKLLLDQGATVNVRNERGYTPFMYACEKGNKDIVTLLMNFSAIDATDNFGKTALHYAVENQHFDIVEMLIKEGADIEVCDRDGLKPRDVAVSLGLRDIEELFPEEILDFLPTSAEQYETFEDIAPSIFPDHKQAAYSQDIPKMLRGMRVDNISKHVYESNISLADFLTIDDAGLQSIGIEFEYQRKRILLGLLKFHGHPFSPKSIELVSKKKQKNMYEYYEMYAGYLKHLVMMECGVAYLNKLGALKNVHKGNVDEMLALTYDIQKDLVSLMKLVQQISINSTKNPLYIAPATSQRTNILRPLLKYSVIIGMGIFISFKLNKLVH